jgi:hypothetical protein
MSCHGECARIRNPFPSQIGQFFPLCAGHKQKLPRRFALRRFTAKRYSRQAVLGMRCTKDRKDIPVHFLGAAAAAVAIAIAIALETRRFLSPLLPLENRHCH